MVSSWYRPTLLFSIAAIPPLCPPLPQLSPQFKFCCRISNNNINVTKHLRKFGGLSRVFGVKKSEEDPYLEGYRVKVTAKSMDDPPPGYRSNVGVCLINSNNQVFVASRLDVTGAWQMPQGGVDEREDPRAAAIRELREETGVTSAEILAEVPHWLTYDFPPAVKEKLDRLWGRDWKGQAQKCSLERVQTLEVCYINLNFIWAYLQRHTSTCDRFLLKFTGDEKEINLAGDGTEAAEFSEWKWMPPEQVMEQVVDFKRPVYEQVFRFFAPHLGLGSATL